MSPSGRTKKISSWRSTSRTPRAGKTVYYTVPSPRPTSGRPRWQTSCNNWTVTLLAVPRRPTTIPSSSGDNSCEEDIQFSVLIRPYRCFSSAVFYSLDSFRFASLAGSSFLFSFFFLFLFMGKSCRAFNSFPPSAGMNQQGSTQGIFCA